MLVNELDVGGEDGGGVRVGEGAAEEREEAVLEVVEPVGVEVLERTRVLVAIKDPCCKFKQTFFNFNFLRSEEKKLGRKRWNKLTYGFEHVG